MQQTFNHLRGFVRTSVECPYPAQYLNLCAQNGVAFWGAERIGEVRLEMTVTASCLNKAQVLAARAGGGLTVLGRRGVLFFLERFRTRYVLIAGFVLCFAALIAANQYIWDFTVEGNEAVPAEEILQALGELGVFIGSPSSGVDVVDLRNRMLLKIPKLSWLTVNVSGSSANVIVRERADKPYIRSRETPSNIVASKAGLITRIDTLAGSARVYPGDMVRQGQLLVSGLVDSAQVGVRLVNARADVTARTWTEASALTPTDAVGKRYTGKTKTRYSIVFFGRRQKLYGNTSQPYAMCDKIVSTSSFRLPGGIVFPIALASEKYIEYEPTAYQVHEEVAEELLRQSLGKALRDGLSQGGRIVRENVTFSHTPGLASAELIAECLELIGSAVQITVEP